MAANTLILIEDDDHKLRQLLNFLNANFPKFSINVYRSFQSGLASVLTEDADLILLDMTLTTFDISDEEEGGRPRPYGGREILEHMQENNVRIPVIVVTQYVSFGTPGDKSSLSDLDAMLHRSFEGLYMGCAYYDIGGETWKTRLSEMITDVIGN